MFFSGTVTYWTVPKRMADGFTSVIGFSGCIQIEVTSDSPEDHVWITHVGQVVTLEDVNWLSEQEGRVFLGTKIFYPVLQSYKTAEAVSELEPSLKIVVRPQKWICIVCEHVNYPSTSVCRHCSMQRKQGPVTGDPRLFQRGAMQRRCSCGFGKTFTWRDTCYNCGKTKKKRTAK